MGWGTAHRPEAKRQWRVSVWAHVSGSQSRVGMALGLCSGALWTEPGWGRGPKGSELGAGQECLRFTPAPEAVVLTPQGCYEKVTQWFADNKHVLGTVGMCLLITQVRGVVLPAGWRG